MKFYVVPVTVFNQNCSIVWCEKTYEAALIDPGGEVEKLRDMVMKLKVKVKKILLTHGHIDHVGGAMELKQYYQVPIVGPNRNDVFLLKNLSFQYYLFGIKFTSCSAIIPDIWLTDGDKVKVGCEIFDIIYCPGHSPGHVVFWNKVNKFIFMGDVLFQDSVGRTDLPGGDLNILRDSINNKLVNLEDGIHFLPGHGKIGNLNHALVKNNFL